MTGRTKEGRERKPSLIRLCQPVQGDAYENLATVFFIVLLLRFQEELNLPAAFLYSITRGILFASRAHCARAANIFEQSLLTKGRKHVSSRLAKNLKALCFCVNSSFAIWDSDAFGGRALRARRVVYNVYQPF